MILTGPARHQKEFEGSIAGDGVEVDLAVLASWTPPPATDKVKEPTWELPLLPTPDHVSVLAKLKRGVRFDQLKKPEIQKNSKESAVAPSAILYREIDSAQQRTLFTHPKGEGTYSRMEGSVILSV